MAYQASLSRKNWSCEKGSICCCTSPSKPRCPANSPASRRRAKRPHTAFLDGDRHEQLRRVAPSLLRNIHTTLFGGRGCQNSLCEGYIVNKDCSTKSDRQSHGYG